MYVPCCPVGGSRAVAGLNEDKHAGCACRTMVRPILAYGGVPVAPGYNGRLGRWLGAELVQTDTDTGRVATTPLFSGAIAQPPCPYQITHSLSTSATPSQTHGYPHRSSG